jgi:aryl-alcohol dehydrogenase-like predicted oxidoreductase
MITGTNLSPEYIRWACAESLRRLGIERIDLYQLHVGDAPLEQCEQIWATLEQLKQEGLIGAYGWSTGDAERAAAFASQSNGTTLQHGANVLLDAPELFAVSARHNLASIVNSPLAMGVLSGKFGPASQLPADDVRGSGHAWVAYFAEGRPRQEFLDKLAAIREILTSEGRTLAQGALAWLWARSPQAILIPGFKTLRQAEENARAMQFGALKEQQVREIAALLAHEEQLEA